MTKTSERHFSDSNYTVGPSNIGNGGLFVAMDAATEAGLLADKTWIGTLGMPTNDLSDNVKRSIEEKLELDYECLTVWVVDDDLNGHYEHFSKTILWPHLHYQVPDHPKSKAYEDHSWNFYVKVNQAFADIIVKNWKRGDTVWVHDYHLMLVPKMVREKLPDAEIGFFMHAAFPSSEIFRCLATRTALIEGLLGANLVGFQAEEYVYHFLQTCSRLLNVEATKHGIILDDGRFVHTGKFPMGIDVSTLEDRRSESEVAQWIETISQKYKGKRIIAARDKLDAIRGVRQKLLAYEKFLHLYPDYRQEIVLIQIATSGQEDDGLNKAVSKIVQRINATYSGLAHQPLVFLRQDIDYSQWLALITVAECVMITSLREGMNLTGHEFINCQDGTMYDAKFGPLILGEFTGAAAVLGKDALLVNPWDLRQCATTLKQALDMKDTEKEQRWHKLHNKVATYDAINWYKLYFKALEHAYKDHSVRDATAVPRLSLPTLKKSYFKASKRLIILDYEGTLANWDSPGDNVTIGPKRACDILNDLIEDEKNIVYVMSGRSTLELDSLFKRVPRLGLIAENGAYLLEFGSTEWHNACDMDHIGTWKEGVLNILEYYHERIRGSKIEEFDTFLELRYDQAEDVEMAFKQCAECASHISEVCHSQGVHAVPVDRGLCVSNIDINKSSACEKISKSLLQSHTVNRTPLPDFLLVIGDSREDEYVFDWAQKMTTAESYQEVITVTVGQRNTAASAAVPQGIAGKSTHSSHHVGGVLIVCLGVLSVLQKLTAGA